MYKYCYSDKAHLCKGSTTSTLYQTDNCIDEQLTIRLEAIYGKQPDIVLFFGFEFLRQTEGLSFLGFSRQPQRLIV